MMEPMPAQPISYALSSASAEHQQDYFCDQQPNPQRELEEALEQTELDAVWLSQQTGASVGCTHRIVRHLASGGMGHVFVAEHVHLGANAAVKVPRYADATGRRIIEAEAKLLAKLEHPNIVKAMDVGQLADGRAYMLMELASGIELDSLLDACGSMSFERCLAALRQVACAVDYLHLRGIVHGDIKPANILIDVGANDFIKLVDFGIASANTRDERRGVLGTPAYMAPEQARGEAWGALSDVYAVAALALEMLTGHPPYDHHTAQDVLTAILTDPTPLPSSRGLEVPGLDAVFERGLHADPERRFPRASAFVSALADVLRSAPVAQTAGNDNQRRESGIRLRQVSAQAACPPPLAAARAAGVLAHPLVPIAPLAYVAAWFSQCAAASTDASEASPDRNGRIRGERALLRLAACLVAAVCVFSAYG